MRSGRRSMPARSSGRSPTAPRVLRFYRDWIADCPDELTTLITERRAPATLAGLPADLVGQHVIAVTAIYAGSVDEGEKVVRPLKEFGSPALDRCAPMPYLTLQADVQRIVPTGVVVLLPLV